MAANELLLKALFGILIPALVAGITWGAAWRIWNRSAEPVAGGNWAGALAVGLALIVGYFCNEGWAGFPPKIAEAWLPFVAALAIIAGVVNHFITKSLAARSLDWLSVIGAAVWLMTSTPRASWRGGEAILWLGGMIALTWIVAMSIDALAARWPGASIPLALWVWSAGIAGALASTGSITYGHLAGILAAIMGAGVVAAWIKPTINFGRGAVATLIVLGNGFLLCGYFYSELPASSALILIIAPVLLWLGDTAFVRNRRAWLSVVLRAAFIAAPVMLAMLFALWPMLFPKASTGSKSGGDPSAEYYK